MIRVRHIYVDEKKQLGSYTLYIYTYIYANVKKNINTIHRYTYLSSLQSSYSHAYRTNVKTNPIQ